MSKNMIQFALSNPYETIVDTVPIESDNAKATFDRCLAEYKRILQNSPHREPELAWWIDCEDEADYHTTKHHLSAYDTAIDESGRLVQIEKTTYL